MIRINLVKSKDLFVFLLFVIVIAGFYSRLIIRGSFPGDFDTWANLAMFMELKAYMESLFTGGEPGAFLYPNEHTWIGYGLDFFSGIIWVLYSWLGLNDYLAYWFCILTILVLNSYSVYLLSGTFLSTTFLRVVLGLLFSTHFYVYPFLDWPNLICLFPVFFGAYALARYFKTENEKYLLIGGLWLMIQLPLSPYVFTYTLLFAGLSFFLFPLRVLQIVFPLQKLLYFLPLLCMFLLYSVFYLICFPANLIDPLEQFKGDARFFLWLDDIIRPSHLHLYDFREGFSVEVFSHKNLFLGFAILGLSVYGLSRNWKLLVVLIFFLFVSAGPSIFWDNQPLSSNPVFNIMNDILGFQSFIRLPLRMGMVVFALLLMIACWTLDVIIIRFNHRPMLAFVLTTLLLAETTIYSLPVFDSKSQLMSLTNQKLIHDEKAKPVLLHIPIGAEEKERDIRNYKYMISRHEQGATVFNGGGAFFPVQYLKAIDFLNHEPLNLEQIHFFLDSLQIDYVVLHPELAIDRFDSLQVERFLMLEHVKK